MASLPSTSSAAADVRWKTVSRPAVRKAQLWPLTLLIYCSLLPREVALNLGGFYPSLDFFAMLAGIPYVFSRFSHGEIKFAVPDWLMLFYGLWIIVAFYHNYDLAGLSSGAMIAFASVMTYFIARATLGSLEDFRRVLILIAPAIFLAAFPLMIEAVSHRLVVRPMAARIFGSIIYNHGMGDVTDMLRSDTRLGLLRAFSVWPHPIIAGLHLATLLPIYCLSGIRGWPLRLVVISGAFFSLFTVSSAPIGGVAICLICIFYDRLTTAVQGLNWKIVVNLMAIGLFIVEIGTNSGIAGFIVRYASFNPQTGYMRLLIWQYGTASVAAHPWFGLGYEAYLHPSWMTSSIDNHWLMVAESRGLPAGLALPLAVVVAVAGLARTHAITASPVDRRFLRGIIISLVVLSTLMFTVTVSGTALHWFQVLLGGCVAAAQRPVGARLARRADEDAAREMTGAPPQPA